MGIISTTGGNIYLIGLRSGHRVAVQYVPEQLNFNRSLKLGEIAIVGRNIPKYHYTGGKTQLKLKLDFYAVHPTKLDVIAKVKELESWTYNEGDRAGVELVKIVFGELFQDETWVLKGMSHSYTNFTKSEFLPQQAYVDLTFELDTEYTITRQDIPFRNSL